jgi:hypothetical protein
MALALLLAAPAAAQPSHLEDQGFAPRLVEIKGTAQVNVVNSAIVTTVTAAVPIQRSQAVMGRFYHAVGNHLTSGAAQTPSFLFVNLSTNTVMAYWDSGDFNSIEASINSHFHVYLDPVVTSSGTALPIYPGEPSQVASKMQAYHAPTVSFIGNVRFMVSATGGLETKNFHQAFIIPPGRKAIVSVANSSNNRQTVFGLTWAEE